ncbi:TIGR01777 family oxidoreductase [Parahaliea mediterranea]|uniref:TIGR01777 family oxidoreductase n=1 Tax=Parahaliea mediterranea TaxID=651086 RepID=A0A939IK62_9GAMM|nr:TIGR01777 family oxidoreductase [Parahaliea mediterranea]MBN7798419.1 TIGR01777 family oxidoreductase [Parahaliea mediterranea]
MEILVSGGTGFIGTALIPALCDAGHRVTVLTRQSRGGRDGLRFVQSLAQLREQPVEAVVNLAGASMAGARWSRRYKRELVSSRLDTTGALIAFMREREQPPHTLLSASAVGYYGHQGDHFLAEEAAPVPGFASDLCRGWEQVAAQAEDLGVRTCYLRLGVVLDAGGGALVDMARPFRLGIANWMGRGDQWLSWIHRDDVVAAILFLLDQPCLHGAFNLTAPVPVTGREFCEAMRRRFRTLPPMSVPGPVLKLALGEMAEELLLSGQRVVPSALREAGFEFCYPELDQALDAIYPSH